MIRNKCDSVSKQFNLQLYSSEDNAIHVSLTFNAQYLGTFYLSYDIIRIVYAFSA